MRRKKIAIEAEIEISSLNERGYGVGLLDGRPVHVLNALPGEKIKVNIFKRRKGIYLGENIELLESSKIRVESKESHFLSCSPWQIITVEEENKFKKKLIQDFYKNENVEIPDFDVVSNDNDYNYRNKVEFAFYGHTEDGLDKVTLAFHARESGFHKIPTDSCELLPKIVNAKANLILQFINENKIVARQLKGLLLRYSYFENNVTACIYVKDEELLNKVEKIKFDEFFANSGLKNLVIMHSDFRSPAFIDTDMLFSAGDNEIIEKVLDKKFTYANNGFFQINPPVFAESIKDMRTYLDSIDCKNLVAADIYAGVGTIGLLIADKVKKIIGVEITPKTKFYAEKNASDNGINNFEFFEGKAEVEGLEWVEKSDILVLDPPRSGLHLKVVEKISKSLPKYIIYLSCNPKTQAENIRGFISNYDIKFFRAYNYYPHTPHCENLCILERKS